MIAPKTTIKFDLESALTCLCTNKNASQVAAAGRNVLQIFKVESDSFSQLHKIKPSGRGPQSAMSGTYFNSQLNYSVSDIAWSTVNESVLATASTNGSISIWNLQSSLSIVQTFPAHLRTTHRIIFNNTDSHTLLSASQDGTVKLFDLREDNKLETAIQFSLMGMNTTPARDVQYCPNTTSFSVAHENGQLVLWDIRMNNRQEKMITCHACPINSIDWHPGWSGDSHNWLATTGSRDHMVKVWDFSNPSTIPSCIYFIRTSNVSRIRWRPEEPYQLASCCNLMFDLGIHVWDLKRPYIPSATFEGHKDLVTAIAWKTDKNSFFSVGKDGLLLRHSFNDAISLADSINPMALSVSPSGEVMTAISQEKLDYSRVSMLHRSSSTNQANKLPQMYNKLQLIAGIEEKAKTTSVLFYNRPLINLNKQMDASKTASLHPDLFVNLATNYRLYGGTLLELCEQNAIVAQTYNQPQLAGFWMMLVCIFNTSSWSSGVTAGPSTSAPGQKDSTVAPLVDKSETEKGSDSRQNDSEKDTSRDKSKPDTSTGNTDDSPDNQTEDDFAHLSTIAGGMTKEPSDFLFHDDGDQDVLALSLMFPPGLTAGALQGGLTAGALQGSRMEQSEDNNFLFNDSVSTVNSSRMANDEYFFMPANTGMSAVGQALPELLPSEAFEPRHALDSTLPLTSTDAPFDPLDAPYTPPSLSINMMNQEGPGEMLHQMDVSSSRHVTHQRVRRGNTVIGKNGTLNGTSKNKHLLRTDSLARREATEHCQIMFPSQAPLPLPPVVDLSTLVPDQLVALVEAGHMQTVCTAIIVLGDRISMADVAQDSEIENWFMAYIDLLSRFRLWCVITRIIKLTNHPAISALNQQSTRVVTKCGRCNKVLDKYGTFCHRHKDPTPIICCICHQRVKGTYLWCQGCSHGGHVNHILDWLKHREHCPSGCGHRCEYT